MPSEQSGETAAATQDARAKLLARWEAVETFKALELASMTEERAWQIICSLRPFETPALNPMNGLGLVEQQRIFHKSKHAARN